MGSQILRRLTTTAFHPCPLDHLKRPILHIRMNWHNQTGVTLIGEFEL
jgi:hypothetical protein